MLNLRMPCSPDARSVADSYEANVCLGRRAAIVRQQVALPLRPRARKMLCIWSRREGQSLQSRFQAILVSVAIAHCSASISIPEDLQRCFYSCECPGMEQINFPTLLSGHRR